jgi:hypothetical protein
MNHCMRHILGLAGGCLILVTAPVQSARADQPITLRRPNTPPAYGPNKMLPMHPLPVHPRHPGNQPIGGDWWRINSRSPYNPWRNPYWYPPHSHYYPYPPIQMYPYYPVPQPYPWGGIGFGNW